MVRLQVEAVQEGPKERTRWESEPALEVRNEHHAFSGYWRGLDLAGWPPTFDALGDAPGSLQPFYLG